MELPRPGVSVLGECGAHPGTNHRFPRRAGAGAGCICVGWIHTAGRARRAASLNTSTFFNPSRELVAAYRKIHLFDVKAPDREYVESRSVAPGREIVTAKAGAVTLGFSICYDLRFPELYRLLALRGAEVLAVPAAFTLQTGKDHWELLLRARAVENQAYVIAPAQWGQKADGRWTYGRSVIVDSGARS